MERGKKVLVNTILLTAVSFLMRGIGMIFQVYLSQKIGAAGVGLFQLIMSIYLLFTTFAISGIRFATTRLVSEELGISPEGRVDKVVRRCLIYAVTFGAASSCVLFLSADFIGMRWIKDMRSVLSLKVLASSLPFLAMSSVMSGYFTAVCRIIRSATAQFAEQLTRIFIVWTVFSMYGTGDLEFSCAVIMAGGAAGDFVSFSLQYIIYRLDRRRYTKQRSLSGVTGRMLGIALPLALSSYARTALSTLQQLLIPAGFEKSGATAEKSLADYGIIHGMVLPVITFPSALFYSLAEIIVPELTEAQVRGNTDAIKSITGRTLRLCALFSIGVAIVLYRFSYALGFALYGLEDVGRYIRVLSVLMPIMYLDSITDGMLRGLGQHMHSMWYNIADSVISLILVYLLLPKWAVSGYIFIICFTEIFNFSLSIGRLIKVTKIKINPIGMLMPLFSAFGAANLAVFLLRCLDMPLSASGFNITVHILFTLALYFALLFVFRCFKSEDRIWLKNILRKKCKE